MIKSLFSKAERSKVIRIFLIVLIVLIFSLLVVGGSYYNRGAEWLSNKTNHVVNLPKTKEIPFHLGLDLRGGIHLIYEADLSQVASADRLNAMEGARDVIERRVNVFGVSEPLVQISGDSQLIVELAGIEDTNEAIKMIGETPLLEFKEEGSEKRELTEEEKNQLASYNAEAEKKAEEVLGKVLSNGDFAALAKEYSQDATKDNGGDLGWITESSDPETVKVIKDYKNGEFSKDLIKKTNGFELFKLEGTRIKANPFNDQEKEKEVKASHILICHNEIENADSCKNNISKDEAYKKIKELKDRATPKNFSELAKKNSTDSSSQSGGDLGWFGKDVMVKPFSDTVFSQQVGTISYIVETKFGYHLIYKEAEREIKEYNVRKIYIPIITEDDILEQQQNWKNTELTGKNLKRAVVQFNPNDNLPEVGLEFDEEGAEMFANVTERNVGKQVAIFLDNYTISAPRVNERITGGRAVISGNFGVQEAKLLAQRLNAGALPVPINLASQQVVEASLGTESLKASLKAGMIGFILVALFMILFYRFFGALAVFSLFIYGVVVLAVFKLLPVTLSLSGLAGFIFSIGIAVDANVLIFERLKEELAAGKPLDIAIRTSFERAWPSIRDGNLSTLLTCLILIWFSASVIKGFAIVLGFGILVSLVTSIFVTRNLINLFSGSWLEKRKWLLCNK